MRISQTEYDEQTNSPNNIPIGGSTQKARQRLRKKLEIERDTNLVSFIQGI